MAPRARRRYGCARGARGAIVALAMCMVPWASAHEAIYLPRPQDDAPIGVTADRAAHWRQGAFDVWHLGGNCRVRQGCTEVRGPEAVLWIENGDRADPERPVKVIAYFERNQYAAVTQEHAANTTAVRAARVESPAWFGRLISSESIQLQMPAPQPAAGDRPAIVDRGLAHFGPQPHVVNHPVEPAQFTTVAPPPGPSAPTPVGGLGAASFRRFQVFPRSDIGYQIKTVETAPGETALVVSGGVNVVIEGLTVQGMPAAFGPLGNVDIETDRAVIWTSGLDAGNLSQTTQESDRPLEIYMEGNIVFRQGDRTVYADRMFYDARRQIGIILNAELLTPPPPIDDFQYPGMVRLRAAAIRQLDASRFVAQDAFVTTSRLEDPSYKLTGQTITLTDVEQPVVDPLTGQPGFNPFTGGQVTAHQYQLESQSNFLYVSGVPVFYWPTMATDLEKPSYYIDNFRIRNDSVFGFQTLLELDMFQLLGYDDAPQGVEWDLDVDYLSLRGLGLGTGVEYGRDDFFGVAGPTTGRFDAWGIKDHGLDNLGFLRRNIVPEKEWRGRVFWNHHQKLVGGLLDDWFVQGEVGLISDRTFLQQYFENEWDDNPDQLTGIRLKKLFDNQAFSVEANGRLNDFFTQTQWLPRLDHYWIGQPVFDTGFTWYEHSSAAYANIGIATPPTNPTLLSQWTLLPWETVPGSMPFDPITGEGERFVTRQELDYPLEAGPFKVVPYGLGELGHWGQDLEGNDIQRAWGQLGVRGSIPFWAADPTIRDSLFNLNGLAHKVVFDAEASYADSNQDMTEFPLYDAIDDDSVEEFRRLLFFSPFGGSLAGSFNPKFDPRFYALRSGIQNSVTSPTAEIADDLATVRMGMRHRLQTKRGAAGEERIIDWMTFDSNATYFPDAGRDNFGADIGLIDYDWRWHIGDRFSILSDGAADTFGEGLRTVSIGGMINRPARGNAYLGYRTIAGPFEANVFLGNVNYRLGPKWIGSASMSIDVGEAGNVNQALYISRIGESLIATVGTYYDQSKDNLGFSFLVEPRFLPTLGVTRRTNIEVPPAGAFGLE
jgi:hypothetical protein